MRNCSWRDGLAGPLQDGVSTRITELKIRPRWRVIVMPGDLMNAGDNNPNTRRGLGRGVLEVFIDADDRECPQSKGKIEALARWQRIMQVFPIAERPAGRAQMAPNPVVIPVIGRSLPTEQELVVRGSSRQSDPVNARGCRSTALT